ncbi:MAG TPA: hypothetical protein VK009_05310 [Chloroflexota bacterium]|nr:hypothetical protein [Chloroflexota bacterium]
MTLVGLALLLAACGGTAAPAPSGASSGQGKPATPAQIAAYRGADRQQLLEDGARKEGKFTWYTSLTGPAIDRLFAGFKQKYPFMAPEVFRGTDNELITRATQEAQAGKDVFDLMESPPTALRIVSAAKLLTPYYTPLVANFPEGFTYGASNGLVETAVDRVQYVSFAYNTKMAPGPDPTITEDLLKPQFAGFGIAGSTTGPRWVGSILQLMGEDKGKQFLTQLETQQKPHVYQTSATSVNDLIGKGEIPASPTIFESDAYRLSHEQGAAVKWLPLGEVVVNPGEVGMNVRAPHPYSALLFLDYLLGDAQSVFTSIGMHTAAEKPPTNEKLWLPEQDKTADQIEAQTKAWTDLFNATFR